jgi:hypothetical protein
MEMLGCEEEDVWRHWVWVMQRRLAGDKIEHDALVGFYLRDEILG